MHLTPDLGLERFLSNVHLTCLSMDSAVTFLLCDFSSFNQTGKSLTRVFDDFYDLSSIDNLVAK